MLSVHDIFSNYLEVSPECKDVMGWSQDALLGCSSIEFVHDDDVPVVVEALDRGIRDRRPMHLVCRSEGRDGFLWIATRFHAEEDDHGMYLVAATQAVAAPGDGKAWFQPAEEPAAKADSPAADTPPRKR